MNRSIIGIVGRSRVGKDTTARILRELLLPHERPFEVHHIAKPLKDSIMSMYHLTEEQLHGNLKDVVDMRYGHSPRELCTIWNNKLTNLHGPRFLIHRFFEAQDVPSSKGLIIPDVRFCHDSYEIRRRGGLLLKVVRTKFPLQLPCENHIDGLSADITITNDSDVESLHKNIKDNVIPLIKSKMTRCS